MATLKAMSDEMQRIADQLAKMNDDPDVTEGADGNLRDTLIERYQELDEATKPLIEQMDKIKQITRMATEPDNREAGYGSGPDLYTRNRRDPYAELDAVRNVMVPAREMIGRAQDAIEESSKRGWLAHDGAEEATRKAASSSAISRQLLLTGGEDYLENFKKYLQTPRDQEATRGLTLGTGSVGYMLPFVLDPTIILNNAGSANPWRRASRVETTTSNTWNGVTSAGVNASFLAEATQATDASPTAGQLQITPLKAAAWVFGSFEALGDSNFGEQLPGLFSDARDRLEAAAFATGNGTTQPQGVITALGTASYANTGLAAASGTAAAAIVYSLLGSLDPRWRNSSKASWTANIQYLNRLRQADTAGGNAWWANWTQGQPGSLLGFPVFEASAMSSTTATAATGTTGSAVLLFGDFNQYVIVDRVGASIIYEPMVMGSANATLPSGNSGWFLWWRVGAGVAVPTAFKYVQS